MELTKIQTRKIMQRGKRGASLVLPNIYINRAKLQKGEKVIIAVNVNKKDLFIIAKGTPVNFTKDPVIKIDEYILGEQIQRHKFSYLLVSLPPLWMKYNDLAPTKSVDVFETPQKEIIIIRSAENA